MYYVSYLATSLVVNCCEKELVGLGGQVLKNLADASSSVLKSRGIVADVGHFGS
jgi:hypothetical protein